MNKAPTGAEKALTFVGRHWYWFVGGLVLILAWKPVTDLIKGLLSPLKGAAALLNTPQKLVDAWDAEITDDLRNNIYQYMLSAVRKNQYQAGNSNDATTLAKIKALPLSDSQKNYLIKVWKLPKPIPSPSNSIWDVVDKESAFWTALDKVLQTNYDASHLAEFNSLPFTQGQKDYLMKVWKMAK